MAIGTTSLEQEVGLNILTIPIPRFSDSLVVLVSVVSLVSQYGAYPITHILFF